MSNTNRHMRTPIHELAYSSGLMSQSSWFIEFKKLVQLIAEGKSDEEMRYECLTNNLLGYSKEYRARRVYGYLSKRASMLDEPLIDMFMSGDVHTQKLINLIAIVRGDRLFFEFLYEVYREKNIFGHEVLEDMDFNAFFREKGNQSEIVDAWSEGTKHHLRSTYSGCMMDAELLRMDDRKRIITPPIVDTAIITHMKDCGEEQLLKAVMGVS